MSAPEARGPEDHDHERTWRSALRQEHDAGWRRSLPTELGVRPRSCRGLIWRQVLRETTGYSQAEVSRRTEAKKPPGRKINLLLR
jgi:hypothetical protein